MKILTGMVILSKHREVVMNTRIISSFFCTLAITGCATTPAPLNPPTGWISYDPITSQGVYIDSKGSRYLSGRNANGDADGRMTVYFDRSYKNRELGYRNLDVSEGYYATSFRRNRKDGSEAAGPITVIVRGDSDASNDPGFIIKSIAEEGGLIKGPGQLVRGDGFYLEGMFDSKLIPINWAGEDSINSKSYRLLGTYAYGNVKAYWRNGDIFEGNIVDFFPFNRSSFNVVCIASGFYGHGVLKRPGKEDLTGYFRENWGGAEPTTKEKFLSDLQEDKSCSSEARKVRVDFQNSQAEYNEEMAAARRQANKELSAYFSQLPNKIVNDMARVESASRGSSVEMDKENARKNAILQEILLNNTKPSTQSDPQLSSEKTNKPTLPTKDKVTTPSNTAAQSELHLSSKKTDEPTSLTNDEATPPPNTAVPLADPVPRKVFPFSRSVTYSSTYANLTKEKALETANDNRFGSEQKENLGMIGVINWRVDNISGPVCAIREDIREVGHWICKIRVDYSGETTLNPDSKPSTGTKVQAK